MKKIWFLGALALIAAGCGGNKESGNRGNGADDTSTQIAEEAVPADSVQYFLTADSIGPIHVGEKISRLPAEVPGLYNMMTTADTPDAMAYIFLLDNQPRFTIYDFMEGNADVIVLEGDALSVKTPDGELRLGEEFSKVLELKGVESEWESMDDFGIWYWKWNGLYFGVEETNLPERLESTLFDGKRPPRAADFTPDVKIGYIGTGLPF